MSLGCIMLTWSQRQGQKNPLFDYFCPLHWGGWMGDQLECSLCNLLSSRPSLCVASPFGLIVRHCLMIQSCLSSGTASLLFPSICQNKFQIGGQERQTWTLVGGGGRGLPYSVKTSQLYLPTSPFVDTKFISRFWCYKRSHCEHSYAYLLVHGSNIVSSVSDKVWLLGCRVWGVGGWWEGALLNFTSKCCFVIRKLYQSTHSLPRLRDLHDAKPL